MEYFLAMKFGIMKILIVLSFVGTVFAGASLYYFNASSDNGNIKLEWKSQEEKNIQHYILQRKSPTSSFIDIATINPKGDNSYYSYTDESAYKVQDLLFIYRLKIVDNDAARTTSYTQEVTVSHSISGVKRTWGSIKAMFR
jgi:hypothetical protein